MPDCKITFSRVLFTDGISSAGIIKGRHYWVSDQTVDGKRVVATCFLATEDAPEGELKKGHVYLKYKCGAEGDCLCGPVQDKGRCVRCYPIDGCDCCVIDDATEEECDDLNMAGVWWQPGSCPVVRGACCGRVSEWDNVICMDSLCRDECQDTMYEVISWSRGMKCEDVICDENMEGACCFSNDGVVWNCVDGVIKTVCDTIAQYHHWHAGRRCDEPDFTCEPEIGVCCYSSNEIYWGCEPNQTLISCADSGLPNSHWMPSPNGECYEGWGGGPWNGCQPVIGRCCAWTGQEWECFGQETTEELCSRAGSPYYFYPAQVTPTGWITPTCEQIDCPPIGP